MLFRSGGEKTGCSEATTEIYTLSLHDALPISIAVLGSVLAGVFTAHMPASVPHAARESIGAAFQLGFEGPAKTAFATAMHYGAWISAGFSLAAALLGVILLRARRPAPADAEPAAVPD